MKIERLPDKQYLVSKVGKKKDLPKLKRTSAEVISLYTDDGVDIGGGGSGTSDFNELNNRPKYNGSVMTGRTNIPKVPNAAIIFGVDENITIATSDWTSVSASPYDNQATITLTNTITNSSIIELINDNVESFATYGFAIASASVENNQITIYSIGKPDDTITLTINIKQGEL